MDEPEQLRAATSTQPRPELSLDRSSFLPWQSPTTASQANTSSRATLYRRL
jgi:hypothetical protein